MSILKNHPKYEILKKLPEISNFTIEYSYLPKEEYAIISILEIFSNTGFNLNVPIGEIDNLIKH